MRGTTALAVGLVTAGFMAGSGAAQVPSPADILKGAVRSAPKPRAQPRTGKQEQPGGD
jgi:hypothetical protein